MRINEVLLPLVGFHPTGDLGPFTIYTSKRKGVVWFLRAPPTKPPTYLQRRQRNAFRLAAKAWRATPSSGRTNWSLAARAAGLRISGFNLFVYYHVKHDRPTIATIERITGISLL